MNSIGFLFPFKDSIDGGIFKPAVSTDQALRSDLISLLTMHKGQRVMQSKMYSPIYEYIHEPMDEISKSELEKKIQEKVKEFIPQITVKRVDFTSEDEKNLLGIQVIYTIKNFFDIEEQVSFNIPTKY